MKTWFIAGEARGLNTRLAKRVLERGGRVVATGKDAQSLADLLGTRPDLLAVPVHPNDEHRAKLAVRLAVKRFGRIDVVVNSFDFGLLGAVEEVSAEEVEWAFRSNVFGLLTMTRAVLPQLRAQRSGRILNLSSVGGYRSTQGRGVYCSTKFAVEGLSGALHDELEPLGIHVTGQHVNRRMNAFRAPLFTVVGDTHSGTRPRLCEMPPQMTRVFGSPPRRRSR